MTNKNFESALTTLKERFGNTTLVINSHLNKLLNLTPVKKSTEVASLRKLLDACVTEINLESFGLKVENYSALLTPILIKLLPSDTMLEITKKLGTDEDFQVIKIIEYLKTDVVAREKTAALIAN